MNAEAKLKSLVAAGDIKQAIQELLGLTINNADIHSDAVALSARYQKYLREKHGNTTKSEDLDIELNRINSAALNLIGRLPKSFALTWRRTGYISLFVIGILVVVTSGLFLFGLPQWIKERGLSQFRDNVVNTQWQDLERGTVWNFFGSDQFYSIYIPNGKFELSRNYDGSIKLTMTDRKGLSDIVTIIKFTDFDFNLSDGRKFIKLSTQKQ
jgi:Effector-associated domain 11